jgi:hypothetical protein
MARWRQGSQYGSLYLPRPFCAQTCVDSPAACEAARLLAGDEYVQRALSRTVLSTIGEPAAIDRLWPDLLAVLRARRPVTLGETGLLRAFAGHGADWLANRRGAQGVWSYTDTAEFRSRLQAVLLAKLAGDPDGLAAPVAALRATAERLHRRQFEPYPACHLVCTQDPPLCLYRSAVADLVAGGRYRTAWREADVADAGAADGRRQRTWDVCQDAAYELVEFPDAEIPAEFNTAVDAAARRVCLCYEQQMLANDRTKVPRTARRILARVLSAAGL